MAVALSKKQKAPVEFEEVQAEVNISMPQHAVLQACTPLVLDMAGQGGGKTKNIAISSGYLISEFPELKGFIGANTHMQLSQSTLTRCFAEWKEIYGFTRYDGKENPHGDYVVDRKPPPFFHQYHELKDYNGTICFRNGCMVFIGSLENYLAHDGKEFAWAHLDETKDTKKEALTTVILGRLRQLGLWHDGENWQYNKLLDAESAELIGWKACNPCYIHTSPAEGAVDWILEMFNLTPYEKEIRATITQKDQFYHKVEEHTTTVIYSTYWNARNLPSDYISRRMGIYNEEEILKFIYGYPFAKSGSEFYPYFQLQKHVGRLKVDFNQSMHLSWDFNSSPYMTMLLAQVVWVNKYWHEQEGRKYDDFRLGCKEIRVMQIRICKEFCYEDPLNSTEDVCDGFIEYMEGNREANLLTGTDAFIYGDASGNSAIPGMKKTITNFKIIQKRLWQFVSRGNMRVPKANPQIKKRRNLVNRILEGKIPEVELIIDEECKNTVKDFSFVKRDVDGGKFKEKVTDKITKKKFESLGHTSDAAEYLICALLPEELMNVH